MVLKAGAYIGVPGTACVLLVRVITVNTDEPVLRSGQIQASSAVTSPGVGASGARRLSVAAQGPLQACGHGVGSKCPHGMGRWPQLGVELGVGEGRPVIPRHNRPHHRVPKRLGRADPAGGMV